MIIINVILGCLIKKKKSRYLEMSTMKVSKFSDEVTNSGKLTKQLVFNGKMKKEI